MHKDDLMTPKERAAAMSRGEPFDRLPAFPFLSVVGPKIAGITLREMRNDPCKEAFFMTECYRLLGNDSLIEDYGLHGIGIALGSETDDPENAVPSITKFVLDDLKKVDSLDMSKIERRNDPEFAKRYQAAEIMLEEVGDEVGVDVSVCGPFTAAASICSTEKVLYAVRKDPENLHKLIRFCTDAIKMICHDFFTLGLSFTLCDPIASGTILKRQDYLDFVEPYTREIVSDLHGIGASVSYHICGNTSSIIDAMVGTGIETLSVDNLVDLAWAKEQAGSKVCIAGNVDPVGVMMLGTPDDVDLAVKTCIEKGRDSPCGYIVATGCDIPYAAPEENVFKFMEAVRKYGKIKN